jgi:hypothetical protein
VDSGLSNAVHIDQAWTAVAMDSEPWLQHAEVQCLSAEDDDSKGECRGSLRLINHYKLIERGRRLVENRDMLFYQ